MTNCAWEFVYPRKLQFTLRTLQLSDILVRGCRPGKSVQMTEAEVRGLCLKSREIFLQQSILLELEAPLKICGKTVVIVYTYQWCLYFFYQLVCYLEMFVFVRFLSGFVYDAMLLNLYNLKILVSNRIHTDYIIKWTFQIYKIDLLKSLSNK